MLTAQQSLQAKVEQSIRLAKVEQPRPVKTASCHSHYPLLYIKNYNLCGSFRECLKFYCKTLLPFPSLPDFQLNDIHCHHPFPSYFPLVFCQLTLEFHPAPGKDAVLTLCNFVSLILEGGQFSVDPNIMPRKSCQNVKFVVTKI